MISTSVRSGVRTFCFSVAAGFGAMTAAFPLWALDEQAGETDKIKACERRLCTLLVRKEPKGDDLKCELSKTWGKSSIKNAESRTVKWGFGDARCAVQINISRAAIVAALTKSDYTFEVPSHTANCLVEQEDGVKTVKATLAPKIVFKDGKADKIWVNLQNVEGPSAIKGTIWTAAQLQDNLGFFHRKMIKSVNKFIFKTCPTRYPQTVASSAPVVPKPKPAAASAAPAAAAPPAAPAPK